MALLPYIRTIKDLVATNLPVIFIMSLFAGLKEESTDIKIRQLDRTSAMIKKKFGASPT